MKNRDNADSIPPRPPGLNRDPGGTVSALPDRPAPAGDRPMRSARTPLLALLVLAAVPPELAPAQGADPSGGDGRVVALLEPIRRRHDLPALAGALVTAEGPVAVGAVGLRRRG